MSFWAATRVQPRRERVAQFFLEQAGFEVYLPKIRERRIRKGKRVETLLPLFPSYMFLRIELQWREARRCPRVIKVVASAESGAPIPVPDEIVDVIRSRERDGALELPKRKL